MTSSEKLRALEPEGIVVSDAPYEGYSDRVLITEAGRDLLADVVEAAEWCVTEESRNDAGLMRRRSIDLSVALTALREHLEGRT